MNRATIKKRKNCYLQRKYLNKKKKIYKITPGSVCILCNNMHAVMNWSHIKHWCPATYVYRLKNISDLYWTDSIANDDK